LDLTETDPCGKTHQAKTTRAPKATVNDVPKIIGKRLSLGRLDAEIIQTPIDSAGDAVWFSSGGHELDDPSPDKLGFTAGQIQIGQGGFLLDACHGEPSSLISN
jgi:hypothetical protein